MSRSEIEETLTRVKANSRCTRRQVAAALVGVKDNQLYAVGWNHLPVGRCDKGQCPRGQLSYEQLPAYADYAGNCDAVHAEVAAIRSLAAMAKPPKCVLYVTERPCGDCAHVIEKTAWVKNVVVVNKRSAQLKTLAAPGKVSSAVSPQDAPTKEEKRVDVVRRFAHTYPVGTVIRWTRAGQHEYAVIKSSDNSWRITGDSHKHGWYGSNTFSTKKLFAILKRDDVTNVAVATSWTSI